MDIRDEHPKATNNRFDFDFLLALTLSSILLIGIVIARAALLPKLADVEIEVSQLTILALSPTLPWLVSLLPAFVIFKEFFALDRKLRRTLDGAVIAIVFVLGSILAWAMFEPLTRLIGALDG